MDNKYLFHIFEGKIGGDVFDEILYLTRQISPAINSAHIREIHEDVKTIFSGADPHFQKSNLPYHNLRHSQMVVLAAVRLFHGLHCNNVHVSADTLFKGLLAAYFHDTGMLLLEGDPADSGAEYIANHEARSITFLNNYTLQKGFREDIRRDCAIVINYTDLDSDPATFNFHSHEIQLAGQVIGSADILAQMADRYYLEYLPLLFKELETGGVSKHGSAMQLLEHTSNFYQYVVLKRLITTFSNTSQAMRAHFRERYRIDHNLYSNNIEKNIAYSLKITSKCNDIECLKKYLKRTPPTT